MIFLILLILCNDVIISNSFRSKWSFLASLILIYIIFSLRCRMVSLIGDMNILSLCLLCIIFYFINGGTLYWYSILIMHGVYFWPSFNVSAETISSHLLRLFLLFLNLLFLLLFANLVVLFYFLTNFFIILYYLLRRCIIIR